MACYYPDKRIVVGRTKKKALVTVCKNCSAYGIPHLNYFSSKYEVTFSLLSEKFVDSFENIELEDRTDLEEFLNRFVTKKEIQKSNRKIKKWNRRFLREQRRLVRKGYSVAMLEGEEKYFPVQEWEIQEDMSYWELILELWNENNEKQVPKNLHKPYYRNFMESIDRCYFSNRKEQEELLDGARVYTQLDQERNPNFHYVLKTGEDFCLSLERPEYLEPVPRKLSAQEIERLVTFLKFEKKIGKQQKETKWEVVKWCWNSQNYEYNEYSPSWFPQYRKLAEDAPMPDYTKLNETYSQ